MSDGVVMRLCVICGEGVWLVESACQKKGMGTGTRSWVCRECVAWVGESQKAWNVVVAWERRRVRWSVRTARRWSV